jgi:serine/threonine protein phosphatase 1
MMDPRTFVIGDIHGRIEALREVLSLSGYVNGLDRLILLGDVCDRGGNTREVIDLLLTLKDLVAIMGNHDIWALRWMDEGIEDPMWPLNGGRATKESYGWDHGNVPLSHKKFLRREVPFYEADGCLFVHGGFDPSRPIGDQNPEFLAWDREIISYAEKQAIPNYKRVFIGHTLTEAVTQKEEPAFISNLVMLDCGAGYSGRLCMMNTEDMSYVLSARQGDP